MYSMIERRTKKCWYLMSSTEAGLIAIHLCCCSGCKDH